MAVAMAAGSAGGDGSGEGAGAGEDEGTGAGVLATLPPPPSPPQADSARHRTASEVGRMNFIGHDPVAVDAPVSATGRAARQ